MDQFLVFILPSFVLNSISLSHTHSLSLAHTHRVRKAFSQISFLIYQEKDIKKTLGKHGLGDLGCGDNKNKKLY